ncbi:hypothetical protein, partial [Streptomyces sp. MBT98]
MAPPRGRDGAPVEREAVVRPCEGTPRPVRAADAFRTVLDAVPPAVRRVLLRRRVALATPTTAAPV